MKRIMMTLAAGLFAFGGVSAQNQDDAAQQAQDFDVQQVQPMGTVETNVEQGQQNQQQDTGTLVLTHTTPEDQHANFDVVGPNGFHDHFDFEDAAEGEHRIEDLEPGIYSIAASDESLELAHTVIEVTAGQTTSVHVDLAVWDEAARIDPASTYGQAGMQQQQTQQTEQTDAQQQDGQQQDGQQQDGQQQDGQQQDGQQQDGQQQDGQQQDAQQQDGAQQVQGRTVQPGYPYGAWGVGPTRAIDNAEVGAIEVLGPEDQDFQVVITGPNGYSDTAGNGDTISDLFAGQYVLAATGNELDLAVTTVEVQAGQQLQVEPNFSGAGGQQQNGQQQDGQQQDGQQQDGQQQDGQQNDQQQDGQQNDQQQDGESQN